MVAHRLQRYAAPLDEPVPLDQDGFLVTTGRSGVVPVVDLPAVSRNFALLAAGGAGKTTVLFSHPDRLLVLRHLVAVHYVRTSQVKQLHFASLADPLAAARAF
ncbi:hypothetical protein [Kutzneria sp. CA-103260]|uniref:hypothetical protein n=1 Tax=Kutzneria sp. CA-103260 TaxID=2802641 RepID=UPI001BAB1079|nr:hypothetical protein [Kutzneria sp. CA-103260]